MLSFKCEGNLRNHTIEFGNKIMGKFLTIGILASSAAVAYALYFDYTRRTSPDFRKNLKKKAVKQQKVEAKEHEASKKSKLENVRKALSIELESNPIPTALAEKEGFFMQQVALGEQLANSSDKKIDAAICFYKALAVYPNPTDILGIYQRSVPEDIYELVVMMIAVKPPAAVTNILGTENSKPEYKPSEQDLD